MVLEVRITVTSGKEGRERLEGEARMLFLDLDV